MRTCAVLLLLFATGCPGTTDDTGESVEIEPYWFWVVGNFGYDADAAQGSRYVAYNDEGESRSPGLSITLASEEYARDYDPSLACSIVIEHPGPLGEADWTGDADVDLGFEIDPTDSATTVNSNCDLSALDSAVWGDSPLDDIVANTWGVGVNTLDADLVAPLITEVDASEGEDWATDYEPYAAGGGFHSSAMVTLANPGGWTSSAMTRGYAVDDTMTALTTEAGAYELLLASDITDGVPPTGIYVTTTLSFLNGAQTLVTAGNDTGDTGDSGAAQ